MKKLLSALLILTIMFSATACSAQTEANSEPKSGTVINLDGKDVSLVAYNINDNNYFKLREIANILKGSKAHFDVKWNDENQAVEIISNVDYSTNENLSSEKLENVVPVKSNASIIKDSSRILLNAYNIEDNNYFKLRDLASVIDFYVGFDEDSGKLFIDTSKEYEYPTTNSTQLSLNTKYLSFYGMPKAFIDKKCGNTGNYNAEFGLVDYGNGFMVGYNCLGTDMIPQPTDCATTLQISLDNLFFNCPVSITAEQINSIFGETYNSYNDMDMENLINANYCGKCLTFYPDLGLGKNTYACISTDDYTHVIEPAAPVDNFSGYYEDDETQSYMTITFDGLDYYVDAEIVRNASGKYKATIIDEKTLSFTTDAIPEQTFQLTRSDDGTELTMIEPEWYVESGYVEWHFVKR